MTFIVSEKECFHFTLDEKQSLFDRIVLGLFIRNLPITPEQKDILRRMFSKVDRAKTVLFKGHENSNVLEINIYAGTGDKEHTMKTTEKQLVHV